MATDLYKKRIQTYHRQLLRYCRLIFNDHFILVVFLLLGLIGYLYSQYLAQIAKGDGLAILIAFLGSWLVTQGGALANFLSYADSVYLLPKEYEIKQILKNSLFRSFLIYALIVCFAAGALSPLLKSVLIFGNGDILYLTGIMFAMRFFELITQILNWLHLPYKFRWTFFSRILSFVLLGLTLFVNRQFALFLSFFSALALFIYVDKQLKNNIVRLNWQKAISDEESRINRQNHLISLFTDVPGVSSTLKRFRFLDGFLMGMTQKIREPHYYYQWRIFIRDTHFLNLWLRLTFIGLLLIGFSSSLFLPIIFSLLFALMTGYQLLPIAYYMHKQLFFQIYPVAPDKLVYSTKLFIYQVLGIQILLFQCLITIRTDLIVGMISLCLNILMLMVFNEFYITKRLRSLL